MEKKKLNKKRVTIYSSIAVILIIVLWIVFVPKKKDAAEMVRVQQGAFEIVVTTTGELLALSMDRILAPRELQGRNVRVSDIKILDLVAEGTVVKEGDYVAELDRSAVDTRLKDIQDEYERLEAQYESAKLDTSLSLRSIRNEIANLLFDLEEKQIAVEQSIYEPPATQRQTQNNLERAQRAYEQAVRNYALRQEQENAKIRDRLIALSRKERELEEMQIVAEKFTIYAPKDGMIIYHREWSGEKRRIGSTVSAWDGVIATLPDLSIMQSKTYVNEIDISKIKIGQKVRIGVDAFPEKSYTGSVTEVSNIGEQLRNADAKVFEVTIILNESDPILRPAMTSSNQIITATFENVMYVPLEALFGDDSLHSYVYRANGTKQIVVPGEMNENFRIIEQGLESGDAIYLSRPDNEAKFKLVGEELLPVLQERARMKAEEEERAKEDAARSSRSRNQTPAGGRQFNREMLQDLDSTQRQNLREQFQQREGGGQRPEGGGEGQRVRGGNSEGQQQRTGGGEANQGNVSRESDSRTRNQ